MIYCLRFAEYDRIFVNRSMKNCIAYGMPSEGNHANDITLETVDGPVCIYDTKDGMMKSPSEIFAGGVEFFALHTETGDRDLATRLVHKNTKSLPYWQAHPFTCSKDLTRQTKRCGLC